MNTYEYNRSPAQWVPATPCLTVNRFKDNQIMSPAAVVPDVPRPSGSPGTPASLVIPQTPQLHHLRSSHTPRVGITPIQVYAEPIGQNCFQCLQQTPSHGREQIVPFTPKPDQACSPRRPREIIHEQAQSTNNDIPSSRPQRGLPLSSKQLADDSRNCTFSTQRCRRTTHERDRTGRNETPSGRPQRVLATPQRSALDHSRNLDLFDGDEFFLE